MKNSNSDLMALENSYESAALDQAKKRISSLNIEQLGLGISLILMTNKIYNIVERFFDTLKISQAKFIVLMYLSSEENLGMTQAEIARRWKVSDSAISRVVKNLEADKYVERRKRNKRDNVVTITPQGMQIFEQSLIEFQQWLTKEIGILQGKRKEIISDALEVRNLFLKDN